MRESTTYQAILAEGAELRRSEGTRAIEKKLAAMTDLRTIERRSGHFARAKSWKELLGD